MAEVIDITVCDALVIAAIDDAVRVHATFFDEHEATDGFATADAYVKKHRPLDSDPDKTRRAAGDAVNALVVYRFTVGISDARATTEPRRLNFITSLIKAAISHETLAETVGPGDRPHLVRIEDVAVTPVDSEHAINSVAAVTFTAKARRAGNPG